MDGEAHMDIGDIVGPYRIVSRVPGGAYRAVHVERPQRVAISVGPRDGWRDAAVQMLRSARMVEALGHPGVAPIVARGVLADRRPWMATELPSGLALWDLVARRAMPAAEVTALVHDVADVLAHAHLRGIVHRALTMGAIVLATGKGTQAREYPLCIADWGVFAAAAELGVYEAPEGNARGDGRVDVYALGVIAYRAAVGKFPRTAAPPDELPGLPVGTALLIARMLAVAPAERPTAIEVRSLARELLAAGDGAVAAELAAAAKQARAATPELVPFHDDTPRPGDDVAYTPVGPRFSKPKWTPAPPVAVAITSETMSLVIGEVDVEKKS